MTVRHDVMMTAVADPITGIIVITVIIGEAATDRPETVIITTADVDQTTGIIATTGIIGIIAITVTTGQAGQTIPCP